MGEIDQTQWDVVVIGGGPAGMMAAGRAAALGAKVVLLEKNDTLGKKLLITGGGRSNVTNHQLDTRAFLNNFKQQGAYLFSPFSQFSVKETLEFFHMHGMETKIENGNRVFPKSDTAQSVWDVLVEQMRATGVQVLSRAPVKEFIIEDGKIIGVSIEDGNIIYATSFILATGGKSHPETGSTGDGFQMLANIGLKIIPPNPSLVPLAITDAWVKELQGVTLEDVKIVVRVDGVKELMKQGRILFTHFGVSGPTILNMSKKIAELLPNGEVTLALDILPGKDKGELNLGLRDLLRTESNKMCKNILSEMIPAALVTHVLANAGVSGETFAHSVTREERLRLVESIKALPIVVSGLLGADKAIITSGGVSLDELEVKTMSTHKYPNLYIVGDLLDVDRPSGGYSLQLCWTTGWVAGTASATKPL